MSCEFHGPRAGERWRDGIPLPGANDMIPLPLPKSRKPYGRTVKGTLLESVPLRGVTTWTVPVVAPVGTVAAIKECESTVKTAAVPLKLTLVAPVRSVPRILTVPPAGPEVGCVSTNGPRPTDRL